jgi:REP element-mobilizing transposase RayT
LRRIYGKGHMHYVTCSCYRREPRLGTARSRDVFLQVFEKARRQFGFIVVGFVVMPEHVHLLIGEPQIGDPSVVMQVLKQRVALRLLPARQRRARAGSRSLWEEPASGPRHFWQHRFYDFNSFTEETSRSNADWSARPNYGARAIVGFTLTKRRAGQAAGVARNREGRGRRKRAAHPLLDAAAKNAAGPARSGAPNRYFRADSDRAKDGPPASGNAASGRQTC